MAAMALKRRTPSLGTLPSVPPVTMMETPLPTTPSIYSTTKTLCNNPLTPTSSGSLYHICRAVLDQLPNVPGMREFIEMENNTASSPTTNEPPTTPTSLKSGGDPLSKLWHICRRGSSLCTLYNALKPEHPLKVDQNPSLNSVNACKASVYHFIVACRKELLFPEDEMFTITDLYQNDTNGFVKVVNTIQKILNILDERGIITVKSLDENADADGPKDTRDKVVLELLETERKYVQDMETLQNYMRELHAQKILPPDTIHYLFGNLNALVDFQRKFLIQLEEIAEKQPEEQRFGALFVQNEEAFSVYEPYCSNYYSAQDLVVQETPKLQKLEHILNPTYQLPSMLIKPVQRICKYPLLQSELIKSTNKDWPYFAEMDDGLESIKRVTEKVNETQRQHENIQAVEDLKKRVDDWKGISIDGYGSLLLQEKITMTSNDNSRDLHAFFFEKALLFCKETRDSSRNRLTKSNTLSIKKKRAGTLQPKYLILISRIIGVHNKSQQGVWTLTVEYKDREVESFSVRYRNEEQVKLWETTLSKMTMFNKSNVPNTHLMSMPPTQGGHISYFDDEDEEDDFEDEEDEEYHPARSRSNSISAQLHHARSKMGLSGGNNGEGSSSGNKTSPRIYATTPGMNLSPLPRSSSSVTTNNNGESSTDHGLYPASPPPSKPSSPTTPRVVSSSSSSSSASPLHHPQNTSGNSNKSSAIWQRQTHEDGAYLTDAATKFMTEDTPKGRSFSQSAASYSSTGMSASAAAALQTRVRSQSSPNIHKNGPHQWDDLPQVPINSRTYYQQQQQQQQSPPLTSIPTSSGSPITMDTLKIKLSYNDGIYVIVCPVDIRFTDLMEKVEKKIKLVANLQPNDILRLKYQDEDEDFITINSDDDVQMAFESRGASSTVNLFVSH
ncbi:uncharacterized protein BX664DRAFT_325678 [Halteromyces radiatus]|uniref:uncharacterized protein n=1 Tax=Halteromyces radiatus TaxID=101107 RepID=UPI00221EC1A3|nr:uncharacterized protein BX664DRAFT_325678 [Halteromyces radiatus]KAI8097158.1 hypothetical protein BX664DRAFT_325678 [Halteromyces radiatus]